jgi:hypothetical protein
VANALHETLDRDADVDLDHGELQRRRLSGHLAREELIADQ